MAERRGFSEGDRAWAAAERARARKRYLKTLLTDVRPVRRRVRVAERRGRVAGWDQLIAHLGRGEPGAPGRI
jgi:hypothetical protein